MGKDVFFVESVVFIGKVFDFIFDQVNFKGEVIDKFKDSDGYE